jgi:peptidoglycan/xylan/chitin deacetylase (PgdA/CDA1 family)
VPAPAVCRPPYGATDARVKRLIESEGMEQVLWDVAARDWDEGITADEIVERIESRRARAPADPIVLLHDGRGDRTATVEAVKRLLA